MKILAVRSAKAIWLTNTAFINPKGLYLYGMLESMKERYSFLKSPSDKKLPPENNGGYKFEVGLFDGKDGPIEIVQFVIHADGLVVETKSSTEDAEKFLVDLFDWGTEAVGIAKLEDLPIKKIYSNEINFTLERKPIFMNPKLSKFFDAANKAARDEFGSELIQFAFGNDHTRSKTHKSFTIAREIDTAPEANRYYSFASTTTSEHLEILKMLE